MLPSTIVASTSIPSLLNEPYMEQHRQYLTRNLEFLTTFCSYHTAPIEPPSEDNLKLALDNPHDDSSQLTLQSYLRSILQRVSSKVGTRHASAQQVLDLLKQYIFPFHVLSAGKSCNTLRGQHRKLKRDLCIFKVVRDDTPKITRAIRESILIHEVAIGYALNLYRYRLQNYFVFTYSAFVNDLANASDESLDVQSMSVMILQQYIEHARPLKALVEQHQAKSDAVFDLIHAIFLQVAFALHSAQSCIEFVHYDLHHENILLCEIEPKSMLLSFDDDLKLQLDHVKCLPTIIDYGYAVCRVSELLMNHWPHEDSNIISCGNGLDDNWFLPTFDMYRYVTCVLCLLLSDDLNKECAKACKRLRDTWLPYFASVSGGNYSKWCSKKASTLDELHEWRRLYLDNRLAYPKHKHATYFKQGNLADWVRDAVQRSSSSSSSSPSTSSSCSSSSS